MIWKCIIYCLALVTPLFTQYTPTSNPVDSFECEFTQTCNLSRFKREADAIEIDREIIKSDIYHITWYPGTDPIVLQTNSSKSVILKIHVITQDNSHTEWIQVIILIHLVCTLGQIVVSCVYYFYERLETKRIRKMTMMYCSQPDKKISNP
jgi:hypothetical protein